MRFALYHGILPCETSAEASSRGAAFMALETMGTIKSLRDLPARLGETFNPELEKHAIYQRSRRRQQALYQLLFGASLGEKEHGNSS